ncbi:MAG TPA: hypothetical protein GXZ24_08990 [Firmicutes bacterium]|nr:hypothetical protein [Bacillota bacterium]
MFTIEKKFISRKNNVYLVAQGGAGAQSKKYLVQKRHTRLERMSGEAKMLEMLKSRGVAVPGILGRGENYLLLEYLEGELFLDYYCRQEIADGPASSAPGQSVSKAINRLCSWFRDFYTAARKTASRQLIMGDVNFRNFIISGEGKIFGLDLEECREGQIEEDLGSLCAHALTYSPTFTPWKWGMVSRLSHLFCDAFNLERDLVKKEIQKELGVMANRRGTQAELAKLSLQDLLEKNVINS